MRLVILPLVVLASGPLSAQTPADIEVSPPEIQLKPGEKTQAAATGYTEDGDVVLTASYHWTTTDSSVVRVVNDPQTSDIETLVAVAPGAAVVEARAGKVRGFAVIDVAGGTARADRPFGEAPQTAEVRKRIATCADLLRIPPVGSWVKWQTPRGTIIFALLSIEPRDGKSFYRIQVATMPGDQASEGAVIQLLSPTWPTAPQGIAEIITQSRGRPPIRLSGPRLASSRVANATNPVRIAAIRCQQMTDAGVEKITVPGGEFSAHHLRDSTGAYESWIAPEVPFGLVKATSQRAGDIVLVATGTGATSAIVGTPRDMPARPNRGRPFRNQGGSQRPPSNERITN